MVGGCPYPSADTALLGNLAGFLDCQARDIGQAGFNALVDGVILPAMLTSCLVIYVALIGYRLLLGAPYSVSDAVLATLRAGLVILFCSHWTGYEAVFYRTATDGPAELVSALLPPSGLPALGAAEGASRLESAYDAMHDQRRQAQPTPVTGAGGPTGSPTAQPSALPQRATVTTAGSLFMAFSVAGVLAARVIVGLLLAVGPLLIVLSLFNGTLGFFEGWVRALGGAALAATGATVVLALEVAFVEGRLASSNADLPAFTDPELMITALVFGLIALAVMAASARVASAFRLRFDRTAWLIAGARAFEAPASAQSPAPPRATPLGEIVASRARVVADAVNRLGQRDEVSAAASAGVGSATGRGRTPDIRERDASAAPPTGLGQSLRRGPGTRRTLSAGRRDGPA